MDAGSRRLTGTLGAAGRRSTGPALHSEQYKQRGDNRPGKRSISHSKQFLIMLRKRIDQLLAKGRIFLGELDPLIGWVDIHQ